MKSIYITGRFHRRGERFNIQDGTCFPEGLPARKGEGVIAGVLEEVGAPVPKLVIKQLQALLIRVLSAAQPFRNVGRSIVLDALVV